MFPTIFEQAVKIPFEKKDNFYAEFYDFLQLLQCSRASLLK